MNTGQEHLKPIEDQKTRADYLLKEKSFFEMFLFKPVDFTEVHDLTDFCILTFLRKRQLIYSRQITNKLKIKLTLHS